MKDLFSYNCFPLQIQKLFRKNAPMLSFNTNLIQFFVTSVLHQQPEDQLQMQHKNKIIHTTK
jgi:hypothetical protein